MNSSSHSEWRSRTGLTRRAVAGGTLFGLVGWLGVRAIGPALADPEAAILGMLRHDESASHIGRLALASWPDMRNRTALLNHILDDLQFDRVSVTQAGGDILGRRLSERMAADFTAGRTVRLDGWVLSLTEVRCCALAALNNARTRL